MRNKPNKKSPRSVSLPIIQASKLSVFQASNVIVTIATGITVVDLFIPDCCVLRAPTSEAEQNGVLKLRTKIRKSRYSRLYLLSCSQSTCLYQVQASTSNPFVFTSWNQEK